jgi:hypothetical protein
MIKCSECGKAVREITSAWNDWYKLANLLEFLHREESISLATYESALNALMRFKEFALREDERMDVPG